MSANEPSWSFDWSPRTILRLFLVVGGLAVFAWGVPNGSTVHVGIGAVAVGIGVVGLWYESRG